jgi:hypothetical protein
MALEFLRGAGSVLRSLQVHSVSVVNKGRCARAAFGPSRLESQIWARRNHGAPSLVKPEWFFARYLNTEAHNISQSQDCDCREAIPQM